MLRFISKISPASQIRQVSTFTINGYTETIIEKNDYPLDLCKQIIGDRKISVIGYGPQGREQARNLRNKGFDVTIGTRKGCLERTIYCRIVVGTGVCKIREFGSECACAP